MYPYDIFPGMDLYGIFLCVAVLAALISFRFCADRLNFKAKLQNFCMATGIAAIVVGYFSAILFQAFYNIEKYGEFRIDTSTGATFYGGLIGGALSFLIIYFVVGHCLFREDRDHLRQFWHLADAAAVSISLAHAFGRIGCLMAGCCHGAETDKWYGIYMVSKQIKVVPIQLFEALVLFAIAGLCLWRLWRGQRDNLPLYMIAYGVWRFFIEYARTDYRGTTFISFLTPSQLTALVMIVGGVAVLIVRRMRFAEKNDDERVG